jgi:hypothetical protein
MTKSGGYPLPHLHDDKSFAINDLMWLPWLQIRHSKRVTGKFVFLNGLWALTAKVPALVGTFCLYFQL